jgi:hypothetical protein
VKQRQSRQAGAGNRRNVSLLNQPMPREIYAVETVFRPRHPVTLPAQQFHQHRPSKRILCNAVGRLAPWLLAGVPLNPYWHLSKYKQVIRAGRHVFAHAVPAYDIAIDGQPGRHVIGTIFETNELSVRYLSFPGFRPTKPLSTGIILASHFVNVRSDLS